MQIYTKIAKIAYEVTT